MSQTVICIGAAVMKNDGLLAVRQAAGHSLEGQWTIPWGRLESGESPAAAVLREVREESGIVASVNGLLGVQELPEPWKGWIALLYHCDHRTGSPTPDHRETDAAEYLTLTELDALDEPIEPWSEWFMRRVLSDDYALGTAKESNPYHPEIGYF